MQYLSVCCLCRATTVMEGLILPNSIQQLHHFILIRPQREREILRWTIKALLRLTCFARYGYHWGKKKKALSLNVKTSDPYQCYLKSQLLILSSERTVRPCTSISFSLLPNNHNTWQQQPPKLWCPKSQTLPHGTGKISLLDVTPTANNLVWRAHLVFLCAVSVCIIYVDTREV